MQEVPFIHCVFKKFENGQTSFFVFFLKIKIICWPRVQRCAKWTCILQFTFVRYATCTFKQETTSICQTCATKFSLNHDVKYAMQNLFGTFPYQWHHNVILSTADPGVVPFYMVSPQRSSFWSPCRSRKIEFVSYQYSAVYSWEK